MEKPREYYPGEEKPFIEARGLAYKTPIGSPYQNVNLTIPKNTFALVCGEHGTGKTALLLTLAGHMVPRTGSLSVGGYEFPRERNKVAKISGLGIFEGLNELEENISCGSLMRAELDLYGKPSRKKATLDYLAEWDLSHIQNMLVKDLTQPELVRFGIALGMAKDPALLVLDDIEHEFTLEEIKELCALLQDIAHNRHKVVVASCTEPSLTKFADVSFTLKGGN
jgi:ABC-type multidrug transport system ATPase subunit